jgi:5-dehydro-4-deoxyglucarate dehydratase
VTIAGATALPMVVYSRDAAVLDPHLTLRLAQEIPNFVAFKDGRGDVRAFQQIRSHVNAHFEPGRVDWLAGLGDDIVGAYFAAGAEGFTSSLAAFWPEIALALFTAASSGDFARVRRLEEESVKPIYEFRYRRRGYEVSAIKAAMELLGYCAGPVRPPLAEFTPDESEGLRLLLANLGVPRRSERQGAHAASG